MKIGTLIGVLAVAALVMTLVLMGPDRGTELAYLG